MAASIPLPEFVQAMSNATAISPDQLRGNGGGASGSTANFAPSTSSRPLDSRGSMRAMYPASANLYEGGVNNELSPRMRGRKKVVKNERDLHVDRGGEAAAESSNGKSQDAFHSKRKTNKSFYPSPLKSLAERKPSLFIARSSVEQVNSKIKLNQSSTTPSPGKRGRTTTRNSFGEDVMMNKSQSQLFGGASTLSPQRSMTMSSLLSGAGTNMMNHGDHDDFSLSPRGHTGRGRDSTTLNRQSTMTSTFGSPGMSSLSLFGNSPRNQSVSPRASAVRMRGGFSDEMTAMDAGCQYLLNQDAMNNKATGTGEGPSGGDQNAANSGFGNKQINAEDVFHEANMLANRLAELETAAAQLKHNLTAFDPLGKRGGGADAS
ncbi:unnamed protein product, partial [Amoebophrya sp. A120]|eukprot:GSA120T00025585001.1